jgi:hypothetical protein
MTDNPDHLSSEEVEQLLRYIEQTKSIVVGGQALALWCRLFLDTAPQIATYYSLSSDDLDVYGSVADARALAQLLSDAKLHLPKAFDISPNAAVVVGGLGNHTIRIDFMRQILGVDDKGLKNHYVTLTKDTERGPLSINLMHPLDCLRSRLSNINDLHREGVHAISSAKAALAVVDLFLDQALASGKTREAQALLMNLFYIARDRCIGKTADEKFGLNPIHILQKYRLDVRIDGRFRSNQIANAIKKLIAKRDRISEQQKEG